MIIKTVYVALIALVRLVFFTATVLQANVVILMISVNQETAMSLKVDPVGLLLSLSYLLSLSSYLSELSVAVARSEWQHLRDALLREML